MEAAIRFFADGTLIIILFIVAVAGLRYIWNRKDRISIISVVVMAGLTSLLIAKLVSLIYQPTLARPFLEKGMTAGAAYIDNPGFPSDHALLATVAVAAIWWVTRDKKLAIFLAILAIVMCVARVMALVHTPFDVIGGIVLGLSGIFWYRKLPKNS